VIFVEVPVLSDENCHGLGKREGRGKRREEREREREEKRQNRCFVDGEMHRLGCVMC
jgi:hypothetical protein